MTTARLRRQREEKKDRNRSLIGSWMQYGTALARHAPRNKGILRIGRGVEPVWEWNGVAKVRRRRRRMEAFVPARSDGKPSRTVRAMRRMSRLCQRKVLKEKRSYVP